jgi:nitrogen fixation NifU-like protein
MSDTAAKLADLYRGSILEHGRNPRHATVPAAADCSAERDNPLCGDRMLIGVRLASHSVAQVGFDAEGCLISVAAASMLCEAAQGSPIADVRALCDRYLQLVDAREVDWPPQLGALVAFSQVARFPARASCATLACRTLLEALKRNS